MTIFLQLNPLLPRNTIFVLGDQGDAAGVSDCSSITPAQTSSDVLSFGHNASKYFAPPSGTGCLIISHELREYINEAGWSASIQQQLLHAIALGHVMVWTANQLFTDVAATVDFVVPSSTSIKTINDTFFTTENFLVRSTLHRLTTDTATLTDDVDLVVFHDEMDILAVTEGVSTIYSAVRTANDLLDMDVIADDGLIVVKIP